MISVMRYRDNANEKRKTNSLRKLLSFAGRNMFRNLFSQYLHRAASNTMRQILQTNPWRTSCWLWYLPTVASRTIPHKPLDHNNQQYCTQVVRNWRYSEVGYRYSSFLKPKKTLLIDKCFDTLCPCHQHTWDDCEMLDYLQTPSREEILGHLCRVTKLVFLAKHFQQ